MGLGWLGDLYRKYYYDPLYEANTKKFADQQRGRDENRKRIDDKCKEQEKRDRIGRPVGPGFEAGKEAVTSIMDTARDLAPTPVQIVIGEMEAETGRNWSDNAPVTDDEILQRQSDKVKQTLVDVGVVAGGALAAILSDARKALTDDVLRLAERHLANSGDTVLGHFPGYINKANARGASYFDIGEAWNSLNDAERWAAN